MLVFITLDSCISFVVRFGLFLGSRPALWSLQYRQDLLRHTQYLLFLKSPSHKLEAYWHAMYSFGIVYAPLLASGSICLVVGYLTYTDRG